MFSLKIVGTKKKSIFQIQSWNGRDKTISTLAENGKSRLYLKTFFPGKRSKM